MNGMPYATPSYATPYYACIPATTGQATLVHGYPEPVKDVEYPEQLTRPVGMGGNFPLLSAGLARTFPTAFLMFCFGVFAVPIAIVLHMGRDPSVAEFVTRYSEFAVLILPVLFIVAYVFHVCMNRGQPNRIVITITLIGSCITLLLLGELYLVRAYQTAPLLGSTDCTALPHSRLIQGEWENARGFYATCVSQRAGTEKSSFASAVVSYRIQECVGYAAELAKHPLWSYLSGLEESYRCSGWCKEEPPMWTKTQTCDACAPVVGRILETKVEWSMKQVVYYTLFTLMVISVTLVSVHSALSKLHIDW